jgi:predicted extracellular nuclease
LDANDGQGAYNATRTAQATRLISWVNTTVIPAAGDPDVLLMGDFNSYAKEDPITTITNAGYTDLETSLLGANAYSYVFDAQIGHLDYALSSSSLTPQITGIESWHINADESTLFDYNDDVKDTGEAAFEEKPNGASLTPARTLYQAGTPYRASDHDPVLVGINLGGTPCVLAKTISNTTYTDLQVIQAKNTIETLSGLPVIIAGTANITFDAQKSITLNPGFETQPNAVFKTQLIGCN